MFLELLHYLIGLFFVSLLICLIIKMNKYFSKNNKPLTPKTITEQFLSKKQIK